MTYITVPITTDAVQLADNAVERLQIAWPGWEPDEGDLELLMIEILAAIAAQTADAAAQVPDAVFAAIADQLHGITQREGTPATTTLSFTGDSVFVPAATEVDIDGYAFLTDDDGVTPCTVTATAIESGAAANGLTGDVVSILSAVDATLEVTVDTVTADGTDDETPAAFRERAVLEMQLQAKTLVTTRDYEIMALSLPTVGRAVCLQDTTNREVEVYVLDPDGAALSAPEQDELAALLESYRSSNWDLVIATNEITQVNVTYEVVAYPGYTEADVIARANVAIADYLDPATWGQATATFSDTQNLWHFEDVVRVNKLIDVIGSVPGVNYVSDIVIADGGTGSGTVEANGDYTMHGDNPVASANSVSGSLV
jgi:uncharacterized phage protein gp47/JayE